jgi:hypothetical protein
MAGASPAKNHRLRRQVSCEYILMIQIAAPADRPFVFQEYSLRNSPVTVFLKFRAAIQAAK